MSSVGEIRVPGRYKVEILEVIMVGLPFCLFKLLTGKALFTIGNLHFLGSTLLILGTLDSIINLVNLMALFVRRQRVLPLCTLTLVARIWSESTQNRNSHIIELWASFDIFCSFLMVIFMLDSGYLTQMTALELKIWNMAVIFNVFGAGLGQLSRSLERVAGGTHS